MTGFEPATPRPPGVYATRLRHIPIVDCKLNWFLSNFKRKMQIKLVYRLSYFQERINFHPSN